MEQVKLHSTLPQYARINFYALKWAITVTLCVTEDVVNEITSKLEDIPANMFFRNRKTGTWQYQKSVYFDYDAKMGITHASDEADKLLRDMQKDICIAKMDILQKKLKRLDYPSWMSDKDIEYYYGGDERYE